MLLIKIIKVISSYFNGFECIKNQSNIFFTYINCRPDTISNRKKSFKKRLLKKNQSEEEREKKRQYQNDYNENLSLDEKQKRSEHKRNYCITHDE